MGRLLVTGASGFIGRHLVSALAAKGDEVTCLVRKSSRTAHLDCKGVRLAFGDVTEPESLPGAVSGQEIVYHLAGLTLALTNRQFFRVNQDGVRNICQACANQSNPPVLLAVSSLAAAGPAFNGRPIMESDPPLPVSAYGRSKRSGELEAESFAHRTPITIVRPPIVLGEGDRYGLSIFKSIDKFRIHLVPGRKRVKYSMIHAADLADLMILAARRGERLAPSRQEESRSGQGYYFAACEDDVAYDELGQLIGTALGRNRVALKHAAIPLVWTAAAVAEGVSQVTRRPLYMNFDKVREITAGSWICSPRKALEKLGFSVKATLAERLRQTAQWYRSEGWL